MNPLSEFDFLSDSTEDTRTRFVTFIGDSLKRFDLAITTTSRFYGKKLVADLQTGITAIIGPDDLRDSGYLERTYRLSEEEAVEMNHFLSMVVDTVHFTE